MHEPFKRNERPVGLFSFAKPRTSETLQHRRPSPSSFFFFLPYLSPAGEQHHRRSCHASEFFRRSCHASKSSGELQVVHRLSFSGKLSLLSFSRCLGRSGFDSNVTSPCRELQPPAVLSLSNGCSFSGDVGLLQPSSLFSGTIFLLPTSPLIMASRLLTILAAYDSQDLSIGRQFPSCFSGDGFFRPATVLFSFPVSTSHLFRCILDSRESLDLSHAISILQGRSVVDFVNPRSGFG